MTDLEFVQELIKRAGGAKGAIVYVPSSIPKGYRVVAVRPAKSGEQYLDPHGLANVATHDWVSSTVAVIVERERVQVGYTVRSLGRIPKMGETYKPVSDLVNPYSTPTIRGYENDDGYTNCVAVEVVPVYEDAN
jgi:hypothetical protein